MSQRPFTPKSKIFFISLTTILCMSKRTPKLADFPTRKTCRRPKLTTHLMHNRTRKELQNRQAPKILTLLRDRTPNQPMPLKSLIIKIPTTTIPTVKDPNRLMPHSSCTKRHKTTQDLPTNRLHRSKEPHRTKRLRRVESTTSNTPRHKLTRASLRSRPQMRLLPRLVPKNKCSIHK